MQNSPLLWVAKNTARFISLGEGVLAPAKLTNSIFEILFHKDTSSSMEFFNFSLVLPMEKRSWDGRKEQILRNNSGGRLSIVKSTSRKYGYNFSENFSTSFPPLIFPFDQRKKHKMELNNIFLPSQHCQC